MVKKSFCVLRAYFVIWLNFDLVLSEVPSSGRYDGVTLPASTRAGLAIMSSTTGLMTHRNVDISQVSPTQDHHLSTELRSPPPSATSLQPRSEVHFICRPQQITTSPESHNVTLLRISSTALPTMHPDPLLHFNVDSTVYKLIIIITQGSDLSPSRVLSPAGIASVNNNNNNNIRFEAYRKFSRRELKAGARLIQVSPRHHQVSPRHHLHKPSMEALTEEPQRTTTDDGEILEATTKGPQRLETRTHERLHVKTWNSNSDVLAIRDIDMSIVLSNKFREHRLGGGQLGTDTTGRSVRSAVLHQVNPDLKQWEVDMPEPGTWTIDTTGRDATNITVQAFSDLDFEFEFLDYSLQKLELPPIARDPCIVSIRLTSLTCLYNLTGVDLYDDLGEVMDSAALSNPNLDAAQQTIAGRSDTVTAQAVFSAPVVPFFLCLRGYDVTGFPFQRLSSTRVVPRMFAISIHQNITGRPPFSSDKNDTITLWLRNADKDSSFKISARFDSEFVKASVRPPVLKVPQKLFLPIVVSIIVSPELQYRTNVVMTLTATRTSDGVTEQVSQGITVVPKTYKMDHTPPVCRLTSSTGGCRNGLACQLQGWGVQMSVADNMTGVASAGFINTPAGAYTNVQISSMGSSELALAEYRFTCCNTMAVLEVKDNAGNGQQCRFLAPKLDPLTTGTTGGSQGPPRVTSTKRYSPVTIVTHPGTSVLGFFISALQQYPFTDGDHQGVSLTDGSTVAAVSYPAVQGDVTTQGAEASPSISGQGPANIVRSKTESWDDQKYQSFKRDAIIIGAVAGAAGLTIVLVCVAYRLVHRKNGPRSGSGASDITMGGSWESRSESPSSSGSVRSSASTRYQPVDIEMDNRAPDRILSQTNGHFVCNRKLNPTMAGHDDAPVSESYTERNPPLKRLKEKIEDVALRCVVVVKDPKKGAGEGDRETKILREDEASESYRAMMAVQQRLIAMNQRMKKLAEEASGRIDRPASEASGRTDRPESSSRLELVRSNHEHADTPPPGAPTPRAATGRAVTPRVNRHHACCANEVDNDTESLSGKSQWAAAQSIGGDEIVALRDVDRNDGQRVLNQSSRLNTSYVNSSGQPRSDRSLVLKPNELDNVTHYCSPQQRDLREKVRNSLTRLPLQTHSVYAHRPNQSFTLPAIRISERKRRGYLTPELRRHVLEQNFQADVRRSSAPEAASMDSPGACGDKSAPCFRLIQGGTETTSAMNERDTDVRSGNEFSECDDDETNSEPPDANVCRTVGPRGHTRDALEASQMELRQDLKHVRDKLYQFQRRIDRELEAQRRSRAGSGDSSTSGNEEETDER